jgi:hypothetical protein
VGIPKFTESEKLYKREFTITFYSENPEEVPTEDDLDCIISDMPKYFDYCLKEHMFANNCDDDFYNCEIVSLANEK